MNRSTIYADAITVKELINVLSHYAQRNLETPISVCIDDNSTICLRHKPIPHKIKESLKPTKCSKYSFVSKSVL
jgi:hypothetical protein